MIFVKKNRQGNKKRNAILLAEETIYQNPNASS